jgi:hypothetical protein
MTVSTDTAQMPKRVSPLTDIHTRTAKPLDKTSCPTAAGFTLLISTDGAKHWCMDHLQVSVRKTLISAKAGGVRTFRKPIAEYSS